MRWLTLIVEFVFSAVILISSISVLVGLGLVTPLAGKIAVTVGVAFALALAAVRALRKSAR